ncbi:hypothetical protein [Aeromonas molluscorum]|uniref:hypothetical protein n=1 Tax=Aeromonas molluscorum TaxID=271417 RepID=UPI003F1E050D
MNSENLIFKYDGESLKEHKIDVDVLAESLLGISNLLSEINVKLNGTADNLSIKAKPFREGSFEFIIDVAQQPGEYLELLSIIGLSSTAGAASLISTIKKLKGRQIKKLSFTQDGDCKVHLEGESFNVPSYYRALLASPSIRKSLSRLAYNPLRKEGIDSFKIIKESTGEELLNINDETSADFRYKRVPVEDSSASRIIEDAIITFLTMHKDKTSSWRIDYEGETYNTSIKDDEFMERVLQGREPKLFSSAFRVNLLLKEDLLSLDKAYIVAKVHDTID